MSNAGFEREIPLVPVTYTVLLARFLRRQGILPSALLEGTGVPESALQDPEAYLSVSQVERILERAIVLQPRPGLGFEYGLTLDLAAHGLLGFSVFRRASLRELTRMLVDYLRIRLPLMELNLVTGTAAHELQVIDSWDLQRVRPFVLEAYMGSIYALVAPAFRHITLCFAGPRPRHAQIERLVRCPVLWDQPANLVRVQLSRTDTRPLDLSRTSLYADQMARAALAGEEHYGIVLRVRHCVMRDPGRHSTLEGVAAELGVSARTLRRHLHDDGSSFSDIRNGIRKQFALRYLRGSNLSIESIAGRLGYIDQASFARAFREWTGTSPGRYRRGDEGDPALLADPIALAATEPPTKDPSAEHLSATCP